MYRICLINMPFSNLSLPSIALTQLKARVQSRFPDQVTVEVLYLNHDFGKFLGVEFYNFLSGSMESLNTGLGDWFFRSIAFPDLPDNTEKYLERYFPVKSAEVQMLKNLIASKRPALQGFMQQMIDCYDLENAQIAGFTSMFMQNAASIAMARMLKQRNPRVITVIGGANCEFPMGAVVAEAVSELDFVFSGPALQSFPDFVEHCLAGEPEKCSSIRGVFRKSVPVPSSGPQTVGEDLSIDTPISLDYQPFMERLEQYFSSREVKPVLTFETSRGCWWGERAHCTFCGLNGASMGYRAMKPDVALELVNSLFQYSGKVSRLMAVDNILPKSYLQDVLPHLETPADMEIFYEVKADLSEEEIAVLAKSGVTQIQPGIEALATPTLKLMKKGTTVFQNLKLLKLCSLYGVQPHWNLLLGFPGESEETYRKYVEVLPLLTHLYPPSGAYPVRFDRFSPYYYQADSYGLDLRPLDFYALIYPFKEDELKNLAYYFSDANVRADYFVNTAKWIGKVRAKVQEWQARWKDSSALPPRLYCKPGSTIVYDSRSGAAVEHELGSDGRAVLDHLARPAQLDQAQKFFAESGMDVAGEIQMLLEKKLLFQEGERMMSLVLTGDHGSEQARFLARTAPLREPVQPQIQ